MDFIFGSIRHVIDLEVKNITKSSLALVFCDFQLKGSLSV
jgi:hypothetical protein